MRKIFLGFVLSFFGLLAYTGTALASTVVYNNIPDPIPGNVPSVGYEATSTFEWGGQMLLSGTQRVNPTITVLMSSWACQSGHWTSGDCSTTTGATFQHPITVNVYEVGTDDAVGDLIVSKTETFDLYYRPSASLTCTDGRWFDGTTCYNGYAFPINFNLNGTVLPDKVIVGIAYNTSHYGEAPLGNETDCYGTSQGCSYDSLNVGTYPSPTIGTALPSVNDSYLDSIWGGAYCDGGTGGIGSFRLDAGCWTGFLPAIKVGAKLSHPSAVDQCKDGGWKNFTNPTFKNQGQCVSYFERYNLFSASDSLYYNGPTDSAPLYGTGPISFTWAKGTGEVIDGFYDEMVPPETGDIYHNFVITGTVSGENVSLTFERTDPNVYGPYYFTGTLVDNVLTGQLDGPYLFTAVGN